MSAQHRWLRDVGGGDRDPIGSACLAARHCEGWECTSIPRFREVAPGPPIPCGNAIVASFQRLHSTERFGHGRRPRRLRPAGDVPARPEERQGAPGVGPKWRIMHAPRRWPGPWRSRQWGLPESRSRSSRRTCRPSSVASDPLSASRRSASSFAGEPGRRLASSCRRITVRTGSARDTGE